LSNSSQVGVPALTRPSSTFQDLEIPVPPIDEQESIVKLLSALDDKIENNTAINRHLEQIAQASFEQIFIRNAVDEPLGVLSDIAEINPLRTLLKGKEAIYVEMANLPTKGSFPTDWTTRPYSGGMKFMNGDTIMARITPCLENGKTAYINFLGNGEIAFGSTEYIVITPKPNYCNEIFYFLARNIDFVSYAVKNMNGSSGRQRVSGDTIGDYELHLPSRDSVKEFANIAQPIMASIAHNALESKHLSAVRDVLLPRLLSGELPVADVRQE
jgi:type I restriction enzyme S subunit